MDGIKQLALLGACGALGSLLRYGLSDAVGRAVADPPWLSTLVVNVMGCYLLGVVDRLALAGVLSPSTRLIVAVGFLGAFTTFSTYALEIVSLGSSRALARLALHFAAQNVLGVLAVLAGMATVKLLGR